MNVLSRLLFVSSVAALLVACGGGGGSGSDPNPPGPTTPGQGKPSNAVTTNSISPGAVCPNGGTEVDIGIDDNGNGQLDAKRKDANTQFILGLMYYKGEGTPKDYKQALCWYTRAAKQGHFEAQYKLASMYENGEGTPKDDKQTVYWSIQPSEPGPPIADGFVFVESQAKEVLAGFCLGKYNAADYYSAFLHCTAAAEREDANAQLILGLMYANGEGSVPKVYKQAFYWYTKAAEQGHADAQYMLGLMYADGEDTPKNSVLAYVWWSLAAAQGEEYSRKFMRDIEENMTPDQIAKVQKLSQEYYVKYVK